MIPGDSFKQFDRLSFVSRRPARAGPGGEHRSRRPSPSTDFVDYRPYQPGDDFRRVDWNVYGRLGSLQVKLTEGRERLDVVVVLDCSSSMAYGQPSKLEFATRVVAALGYIGTVRADSVRITCLTSQVESPRGFGPFRRRSRISQLVAELERIAPGGAVNLDEALAACLESWMKPWMKPRLVVIVTDLLTPTGAAAGLDALLAHHADLVVVHVVSPEELDPRVTGEVELIDAENNSVLELGVSMGTLAAYRARFGAWLEDRATACRQRGIHYVRVRTDRPLSSVILNDLRRAGILR